jgi:hypothetical protein
MGRWYGRSWPAVREPLEEHEHDGSGSGIIRPMRLLVFCVALGAAGCGEEFAAQPPGPSDSTWSRSFGSVERDDVTAVTVDIAGNVYFTGSFRDVADFGGGPITAGGEDDVYVVKLDTDGRHVWSRRFGDGNYQRGTAIAIDGAGNVVVAGSYGGSIEFGNKVLNAEGGESIFVLTLDAEGQGIDAFTLTGEGVSPSALAIDAPGNIILGGEYTGTIDFGGGPRTAVGERDVYVVKVLPDGSHVWTYGFGSLLTEDVDDLAVDIDGNVAITGTVRDTVDFGAGEVPPVPGMAPHDDAYVVVLDANGALRWAHRLGDDNWQQGGGVAYDGSQLLATGTMGGEVDFGGVVRQATGGADVYAVRYDGGGTAMWARNYGEQGGHRGRRVAGDTDGHMVLGGDFDGIIDFGADQLESAGMNDIYLAELDAGGGHVRSSRHGDANDQDLGDLLTDSAGHLVVVGNFIGGIDLGFGELGSLGDYDLFVAKLP